MVDLALMRGVGKPARVLLREGWTMEDVVYTVGLLDINMQIEVEAYEGASRPS